MVEKFHSPRAKNWLPPLKKIQPDIPVLVYSIEDRNYRIKSLFEVQKINGFVLKSRDSILQLKKAIQAIFESDELFLQQELKHLLLDKTADTIEEIDIQILTHLAAGIQQEEMEKVFKQKAILPNSKSTIEKRIGKLKTLFRANNTVHLIAMAKDLGLIWFFYFKKKSSLRFSVKRIFSGCRFVKTN